MAIKKQYIDAYTCGFFDGEGSIQINPSSNGTRKYWCLTIQISNTHRTILQKLQKYYKIGNVISYTAPKQTEAFVWRIYAKEAERFLEKMLPYSIVKKEAIKIALKFRKCFKIRYGRISVKMSQKKAFLAEELRKVNQKTNKHIKGKFRSIGVR